MREGGENKGGIKVSDNAREIFVVNLTRLMKEHGITQADIAARFGITASTVSDWATGKHYPRVNRMQQLADLFHVPMSYFMSEHADAPSPDERILAAYHAADPIYQQIVLELLESHPKKSTEEIK